MSTVELFQAVVAGGIRDTHFFNGRLLTADDLRTVQEAADGRERRIARAAGEGVAFGLDVSLLDAGTPGGGKRPTLRVTAGLAASRRGDALELVGDVDVALLRASDPSSAALGEFTVCPPPTPVTTLQNFGLYVLTIAPASWYDGMAPMTELRNEGVGTSCGRRYEVEGVRFGLARMDLGVDAPDPVAIASPPGASTVRDDIRQLATELDTQLGQLVAKVPIANLERDVERKLSLLRNAVAHLCFGTEARAAARADPFAAAGGATPGDALERMRASAALAPCEVPLALIYWSVRGVEFVDVWAVRRPVTVSADPDSWSALAPGRSAATGVAAWLQFQRHIMELGARQAVTLAEVRAVDYFRWLPPVGVLPLTPAFAGTSVPAVNPERFFETRMKRQPVYLEGARFEQLLAVARRAPPVALAPASGEGAPRELVWLYRVRENFQLSTGGATGGRRPVLVFASGYAPYLGDAEFDLSHWSFASYA